MIISMSCWVSAPGGREMNSNCGDNVGTLQLPQFVQVIVGFLETPL